MTTPARAVRTGPRLCPDPSRVVTRLFVPGLALADGSDSRVSGIVARVLALHAGEVARALEDVHRRFDGRHRSLSDVFEGHAARVADRLPPGIRLSAAQRELLGATFTHEYAFEAAALCNPSIVTHPGQEGMPSGSVRFVMSARGIGEGHQSCLCFREGSVDAEGKVTFAPPGPHPILGTTSAGALDVGLFHGRLHELGPADHENAASVLDGLGERFSVTDLEHGLDRLDAQGDTRRNTSATASRLREFASRSYTVCFPPDSDISERVLWPATAAESAGIEDARLVRFTDNGRTRYYASYTAFDGRAISQQLLETDDFVAFHSSPIVGAVAANKGLALFPRRIDGRYAALSRFDQETNAIAFSDTPGRWDHAEPLQVPTESWEVIQLGNCGSPIETERGWLVLTHGVGPMRTYSIGALLLDLDDPTRVLARLPYPLLAPTDDERDGYVPNVVYSCGALVHAGTLVIPYGSADTAIGIATVPVADVLSALADVSTSRGSGTRG